MFKLVWTRKSHHFGSRCLITDPPVSNVIITQSFAHEIEKKLKKSPYCLKLLMRRQLFFAQAD